IYGWAALWAIYLVLSTFGIFINTNLSTHHSGVFFNSIPAAIYKIVILSTIPVAYVLHRYRYTKRELGFDPMWIVYIWAANIALYLLLIGSVSVTPLALGSLNHIYEPLAATTSLLGWSLALPSVVILTLGLTRARPEREKQWKPGVVLLRSLATAIVIALVSGTYCAVKGLWLAPEDGKFIFTNIANGCGVGALVAILALSYLQREIYWIGGHRAGKLDERQLQERRSVFEVSYKVAVALVSGAVYVLYINKHNLPKLISDPITFNTASGNYFWPFANICLMLVALPLVVAAYKKRRAFTN
ncbi:MAG: hypothetical protein ABWY71_02920, partial [Candidatus Saccharimonadales bacterium]